MSQSQENFDRRIYFFSALKDWRILSLNGLMNLDTTLNNAAVLRKRVLALERKKLLKSFYDPSTRKKYIYLTKHGENALNIYDHPPALTKRCLLHDAKASEVAQKFYFLPELNDLTLEHQIFNGRKFRRSKGHVPDFTFILERGEGDFECLAGEVEIARKSKTKIKEKLEYYLNSLSYDRIVYFFAKKGVLRLFRVLLKEILQSEECKKFVFAYHPELMTNEKLKLKDFEYHDLSGRISFESWYEVSQREPRTRQKHTGKAASEQAIPSVPRKERNSRKSRAFWPFRN